MVTGIRCSCRSQVLMAKAQRNESWPSRTSRHREGVNAHRADDRGSGIARPGPPSGMVRAGRQQRVGVILRCAHTGVVQSDDLGETAAG